MKQRIGLLGSSAIWLLILVAFLLSSSSAGAKDKKRKKPESEPTPTIYNPYPFDILPSDLDSEIAIYTHLAAAVQCAPVSDPKPYSFSATLKPSEG